MTATEETMSRHELNRLSNIIEEDSEPEEQQQLQHDVEQGEHNQQTINNNLDPESIEQYREMLKLGEEVSSLYKNIQQELSKPVEMGGNNSAAVDYKPVMKKRVYHLNGAYLKSGSESELGTS